MRQPTTGAPREGVCCMYRHPQVDIGGVEPAGRGGVSVPGPRVGRVSVPGPRVRGWGDCAGPRLRRWAAHGQRSWCGPCGVRGLGGAADSLSACSGRSMSLRQSFTRYRAQLVRGLEGVALPRSERSVFSGCWLVCRHPVGVNDRCRAARRAEAARWRRGSGRGAKGLKSTAGLEVCCHRAAMRHGERV